MTDEAEVGQRQKSWADMAEYPAAMELERPKPDAANCGSDVNYSAWDTFTSLVSCLSRCTDEAAAGDSAGAVTLPWPAGLSASAMAGYASRDVGAPQTPQTLKIDHFTRALHLSADF